MSKKRVYIYDGSYQGLLSAIYAALKERIIPVRIIKNDNYRNDLFYDKIVIESSEKNAEFLSEKIRTKISSNSLRYVFHSFHSELDKIEDYIYRYILMGFKYGDKIDNKLTEKYVRKVHDAAAKVRRESHRYKGLIRFKEAVGGKFYAAVEPDYNILILIATHFKNRLSTQDWIIHDKLRETAVIYSAEDYEWLLIDLKSDFKPELSEQENDIQDLWKSFFSAVSIKNRLNPKLQRQFMPKKYWKHLIEEPGSSNKLG
jgi:probable DNA metabolism protein